MDITPVLAALQTYAAALEARLAELQATDLEARVAALEAKAEEQAGEVISVTVRVADLEAFAQAIRDLG